MSKKAIHLVPNHGRGWAVKKEGQPTPVSTRRTQGAAEDAGRPVARRDHTELVTHRPDNTVHDKARYGNDPCPPKSTKH